MRSVQFGTGEFYHLYNRGVEKRCTFQNSADYVRFLSCMEKANTSGLIGLAAYALMPNHFHLLVRQELDGGISTCMQRMLTAYGKYFNVRHDRQGRLWSAPFHAKHIDKQSYLYQILKYIHENPLELSESPLVNENERRIFLSSYPWSSYRHYAGLEHNPLITTPLHDLFDASLKPGVDGDV